MRKSETENIYVIISVIKFTVFTMFKRKYRDREEYFFNKINRANNRATSFSRDWIETFFRPTFVAYIAESLVYE